MTLLNYFGKIVLITSRKCFDFCIYKKNPNKKPKKPQNKKKNNKKPPKHVLLQHKQFKLQLYNMNHRETSL